MARLVLLQGKSDEELPERLLGTFQLDHLDMDKGVRLTGGQLRAMASANRRGG